MENRHVGFLILGIAIILIFITFLFNNALGESVRNSCLIQHGDVESCEMYDSVNYQKYFALGIVGVLLVIGFVLIFTKPRERIITRKIKEPRKKINLDSLEPKEREVIKILQQENGTIFQATLMEKLNVGKVGITRLLDKLEAKQIIERKRRGMNNVVVLRG